MQGELMQKFKEYKITKSEHFPAIMQKYDAFGRHMSLKNFWKTYIQPIDATITYKQWYYFMGKLDAYQRAYVEEVLQKSNDVALTEAQLEKNSLNNILKIADVSLEAIANDPTGSLIHSIPLNTRVRWLFNAMRARDSRAKTNLAAKHDEREQSLFEKMMEGAQYGGYDAEAVPVSATEIDTKNAKTESLPHELPGSI